MTDEEYKRQMQIFYTKMGKFKLDSSTLAYHVLITQVQVLSGYLIQSGVIPSKEELNKNYAAALFLAYQELSEKVSVPSPFQGDGEQ